MKICFISRRFFPAISGMSIYAINLLRQLVAEGHELTMISQYRGDAFGTKVYGGGPPPEVPGVRVVGLEQLGEQESGDFERDIDVMVATIIAEHERTGFDVLHAQYGYPTGWATLIAGKRLGLPVVVSIQGGDGHWVGSCCACHRLAMVRVLDHADAVLIGGESFAREVHERLGTPMDRFTFVPGAVDTDRFRPAPSPAIKESGGPVRILYHGRVDARKGVLDFVRACERLGGDWAATISGIGPDLEAAQALSAELGLTDRITFSGYAEYEAVPDIYRQHHIFASPTYAEGFSNTILEAMASGLAIVSCPVVGVSDCLRADENGLLVAPGDIGAQAVALQRLIDDETLRARLARDALAECRETYSWAVVASLIAGVYGEVMGTGAPSPFEEALPRDPCRFREEPHLL